MKIINNVTYYTIGEVGTLIGKGTQTIKNWYKWLEGRSDKENYDLPNPVILDATKTRFFKEDDVVKLETFAKSVHYGMMSDYNATRWGKRGRDILETGKKKRGKKKGAN